MEYVEFGDFWDFYDYKRECGGWINFKRLEFYNLLFDCDICIVWDMLYDN